MNFKKLVALIALICTLPAVLIAQDYRERDEVFDLSADGKVSIDTYKGSIKVATWDKEEVKVYAKIVADKNWNGTSPEEQLENVKIKFKSRDNSLSIESDYKSTSSWFGSNTLAFVHYEIKMPASANLIIDDYKSDSEIKGVKGNISFETYKGDVEISAAEGEITMETYKGNLLVELSELTADCSFETYKGKVTLALPEGSAFNLDADLGKKGDLDSDFDIVYRSKKKNSSDHVRGKVNGGGPSIDFETYKGDFILLSN